MPIGIYPPTLKSTQPAFIFTTASYPINFTLQKVTTFDSIGHVQIRVVKQTNNRSIVNTALYPDGTIYKTPSEVHNQGGYYSVSILSSDLAEPWQPGYLYKVQMRFGTNPMFDSISNFAKWKKQQIDSQAFSEWSTVMVIKAISQPSIFIENAEAVQGDIISTERTETTLTPMFFGSFYLNAQEKELLDKYKFDIYLGEKTLKQVELNPNEDLVESSGWLQHNAIVNGADQYRFNTVLQNNSTYTLFYYIQTVNGYASQAEPYVFLATRTFLEELERIELRVDSEEEFCRENACINIYLTTETPISGAYVLTRSSEKTNFAVWEDLQYFIYSTQVFGDDLIYRDFTIESGVKYKYAFQQENSEGLRTSPLYANPNNSHMIDFQYSYFYHDGVQLRLMFNQTVNTFKHSVLVSKQDTLGGKYPHLSKNGYAYYAEFPISGLISFQMDRDQTFLQLDDQGFKYGDELAIPRDKFMELPEDRLPCEDGIDTSDSGGRSSNYDSLIIDHNLTDDNFYVERMFRDRVEQFLNNFDYKLYKSPSEGNIIVVLQNVSFTPNATLGRMIYQFSATAYEVLENTLENLNEYGIINIGQFDTISTDEIIHSFGQIAGIYTVDNQRPINVYEQIKLQEEVPITGGYRLQLKQISGFFVERYPNMESILSRTGEQDNGNIEGRIINRVIGAADLIQQNAIYSKAKQDGASDQELKAIEEQIARLENLQSTTQTGWQQSPVIIQINGKEIMVAPNRLYSLTYPIDSFQVIYANYPIIINYISDLVQIEDTSKGIVTAIDASRIWGQLYGVFTDTDDIIKQGYYWDYGPGQPPYRVGAEIDTNFNIYKTLDIFAVIQEETRKQVEQMYGIEDGFVQNVDGEWVSKSILYSFTRLTSFEIEGAEGTTLKIGKSPDGSDAVSVKIGKTGRYALTSLDTEERIVRYIMLEKPASVLINYKCLTTQRRVKV